MSDNQIGIHIYRVTQHRSRKPGHIPFSKDGLGGQLRRLLPEFIAACTSAIDPETSMARPWYFEPARDNDGLSMHGLVHYGMSGFEGDIVDRNTRALRFKRQVSDMDVIPLYYRFWLPESGDYGLVALQAFGSRSCVSRVLTKLEAAYRARFEGYRVTFSIVLPIQLKSMRQGEVKSITLYKRDVSSDRAINQLGLSHDLIDYNVSYQAKPKASLGKLSEFMARFNPDSADEVLAVDGTAFDEAQAWVKVGRAKRKVTLIGMSREVGRIDLSDSIKRLPTGHPDFSSISYEVVEIFKDAVGAGSDAED